MRPALPRIEYLLLTATFFLIPSNLFLKYIHDQAYIRGILIDYLLPKIYLSDIPILFLIVTWLLNGIRSSDNSVSLVSRLKKLFQLKQSSFLLLLLFAYLTTTIFLGGLELPSLFFGLKLLQLTLFTLYLRRRVSRKQLLQVIWRPLAAAVIFQSILALFQYINQSSLLGYFLLGEVDFQTIGHLAKQEVQGVLKILAYGTTPHPNVLAGFLAWALLVLGLAHQTIATKKLTQKNLVIIILGLFLICFYITRSWSALGGVVIASMFLISTSRRMSRLITYLIFIITLSSLLLTTQYLCQNTLTTDNQSIIRRCSLNHAAQSLTVAHPLMGTGLNQSLATMARELPLTMPPGFLQPIHNMYLLWLTETGLVGMAIVLALTLHWKKKWLLTSNHPPYYSYFAPLSLLLIIGTLDHYPLTLQTGQLMLSVSMALALSDTPNQIEKRGSAFKL